MTKILTKDEFIQRAKQKHGNKFDYSLVEYKNGSTKIKIVCPYHGLFEIKPIQHTLYDCGKCTGNIKITNEEIINQFKKIHGNLYDYSLVKYKGDSEKVKIICNTHGIFEQQAACHKRQKQGCPKCGRDKIGPNQRLTKNEFIKRIENIFGKECFDYSKLEYKGAHFNIILICKKCGNEEIKDPNSFYLGFGCLKCQGNKLGPKGLTTEKFIEKAINTHGNKYDYFKSNYIVGLNKIEIICKKHGSFWQSTNTHLNQKAGCPKCKTSKGEEDIAIYLNENKIKYIYQYCVLIKESRHYYDFYLPDNNIIIEFNGKQHYEPIKFFGGKEGFNYLKKRDKIKIKYCKENNIKLIIISYKEIENIDKSLNKLI
jgi:hypothetical protein